MIAWAVIGSSIVTACVADYLGRPSWLRLLECAAGVLFVVGWLTIALRRSYHELNRRRINIE